MNAFPNQDTVGHRRLRKRVPRCAGGDRPIPEGWLRAARCARLPRRTGAARPFLLLIALCVSGSPTRGLPLTQT